MNLYTFLIFNKNNNLFMEVISIYYFVILYWNWAGKIILRCTLFYLNKIFNLFITLKH
jgi:hypothetical protein